MSDDAALAPPALFEREGALLRPESKTLAATWTLLVRLRPMRDGTGVRPIPDRSN